MSMIEGGNYQTTTRNRLADLPVQPAQQPVPGALNALDSQVGNLHDVINSLEQRLGALLSPLPPQGVGEPQGKLARHSLALQIESAAGGVNAAVGRLQSLLNRLEL